MVGIENLPRFTAKLALLTSTHSLMSFPFDFGTQTTGVTHSHGPLTGSMIFVVPAPLGYFPV